MKLFSRSHKEQPKTSDIVMFNYKRPARARQVALGSGGRIWLVETRMPCMASGCGRMNAPGWTMRWTRHAA
ncbi:hypothetical protein [Paludibacterium denitrificans]|uniref:hypothetical protein n=1 Tax=Paludibacterium denitrificans TaxID=2675226 RepID=UPI001E3FAFF4|nr:hypothetical protein [Paludibacterium denitrificans]